MDVQRVKALIREGEVRLPFVICYARSVHRYLVIVRKKGPMMDAKETL